MSAARTLAGLVAIGMVLIVQLALAMAIAAQWVEAHNVSRGGCGYDGTCSDSHLLSAAILGWLLAVTAEVAAAILVPAAVGRLRPSGRTARAPAGLTVGRMLLAAAGGCLLLLAAGFQGKGIGALAYGQGLAECPVARLYCSPETIEARLFLHWSLIIVGAETALAVFALVLLCLWRRTAWVRP